MIRQDMGKSSTQPSKRISPKRQKGLNTSSKRPKKLKTAARKRDLGKIKQRTYNVVKMYKHVTLITLLGYEYTLRASNMSRLT